MKTPHKHAELIKAWADGAKIEMKVVSGKWVGYEDRECPTWNELYEYRIKPEPLQDFVVFPTQATSYEDGEKFQWFLKGSLKLVFDGVTGKLKSAEVL